ncbi:hypothetical protein PR048_009671 [Dryococelus australis]|uniref:Uncharacterized protein n=1 Tax=Dryococelus australis TaxID=614101 RepID=A0ABQ9I0M4_9NEOP|nr:hypothetical protein PR048_009671 [Dryococelus australis]
MESLLSGCQWKMGKGRSRTQIFCIEKTRVTIRRWNVHLSGDHFGFLRVFPMRVRSIAFPLQPTQSRSWVVTVLAVGNWTERPPCLPFVLFQTPTPHSHKHKTGNWDTSRMPETHTRITLQESGRPWSLVVNTLPILRLVARRTGYFVLGRRDEYASIWCVPTTVIRLQSSAFGAMIQTFKESWCLLRAVRTRRTQQEPETRVGLGETECTAATHERAARHPLHTCCDAGIKPGLPWREARRLTLSHRGSFTKELRGLWGLLARDKRAEDPPRKGQGAKSRPLDYRSAALPLSCGGRVPPSLLRNEHRKVWLRGQTEGGHFQCASGAAVVWWLDYAPGFSHVGIVPDGATGSRIFSGISGFLPPMHSGATPYSPHFTLIGSQNF